MDNLSEQPITVLALVALGYVLCKMMSSQGKGKRRAMRGGGLIGGVSNFLIGVCLIIFGAIYGITWMWGVGIVFIILFTPAASTESKRG